MLLGFMAGCDPIIVGGQAINLFAEHYATRDPALSTMGPFTSKDLDLFANRAAAERLAAKLEDATLLLPGMDDASPNAAVVVGWLGRRRVVIDFLAEVLGVDPTSINRNRVQLEGIAPGVPQPMTLSVMNPLDCVRSRLANINVLSRTDEHSLRQAEASIAVMRHFIEDLVEVGELRVAQRMLRDLGYVIRDQHIGKTAQLRFGTRLDPLAVLGSFVADRRLDPRWREMVLVKACARLRARADKALSRVRLR